MGSCRELVSSGKKTVVSSVTPQEFSAEGSAASDLWQSFGAWAFGADVK
jgi:hypothetical protein